MSLLAVTGIGTEDPRPLLIELPKLFLVVLLWLTPFIQKKKRHAHTHTHTPHTHTHI